jgi:hypothetical protein
MRYLLNSAVITAEGTYSYRYLSEDQARYWAGEGPEPISTIGYQETADALAAILGRPVVVDRKTIVMKPGDQALVFRLVLPPGTPRIAPGDKGAVGAAVLAKHFEIGLLRRRHPFEG